MKKAVGLKIPTLLVRGGSSELVQQSDVQEFLTVAPYAECADVGGAQDVVTGDRNDQFSAAILAFLGRY